MRLAGPPTGGPAKAASLIQEKQSKLTDWEIPPGLAEAGLSVAPAQNPAHRRAAKSGLRQRRVDTGKAERRDEVGAADRVDAPLPAGGRVGRSG